MSMLALCAGHDLTIQLRDGKAWLTLLRRTILVKVKKSEMATMVRDVRKNQAK
jgi:hypothetical protein